MEKEEISPLERAGQEQIHGLLFVEKIGWKEIIHDLINTGQLDPWDIDLSLLTSKFLDKVKELEEANFFVSSQVLLAASLLLRFKSDILLNRYIPELDAVLFGRKKEEKKYFQERIELDEEIPGLTLRTPLPRFKKVTLEELMKALGHAINTENRRIRKVIVSRQQEMEIALAIPRQRINIKDRITEIHAQLRKIFANRQEKLAFSELAGKTKEEKLATFVPLLHLDTQHKVWLEQDKHFDEIWILLKHLYEKQNAETLEKMKQEADVAIKDLVREEKTNRGKLKPQETEGVLGKDKETEEEQNKELMEEITESLTGFGKKLPKKVRDLKNSDEEE